MGANSALIQSFVFVSLDALIEDVNVDVAQSTRGRDSDTDDDDLPELIQAPESPRGIHGPRKNLPPEELRPDNNDNEDDDNDSDRPYLDFHDLVIPWDEANGEMDPLWVQAIHEIASTADVTLAQVQEFLDHVRIDGNIISFNFDGLQGDTDEIVAKKEAIYHWGMHLNEYYSHLKEQHEMLRAEGLDHLRQNDSDDPSDSEEHLVEQPSVDQKKHVMHMLLQRMMMNPSMGSNRPMAGQLERIKSKMMTEVNWPCVVKM